MYSGKIAVPPGGGGIVKLIQSVPKKEDESITPLFIGRF
jgi:hypothetical protein